MKKQIISILICPECKSGLSIAGSDIVINDDIVQGNLKCSNCNKIYKIMDSVPRFVVDLKEQKKTKESFSFEWLHYTDKLGDEKKVFLEETQIQESDWKGKFVLDAGCGMGRFTRVALELGAEVVAVDLSDAVERTKELLKRYPKLHLIQCDLLKLPLKKEIFDIVYSQGVVHHTANTKKAFENISELVKPRGMLTVWVYGKAGRYRDFKTNPLRQDRQYFKKIMPVVWLVVLFRGIISDSLRTVTTKMPIPLLYSLCYIIAWIGILPLIKYLTFSVHSNWRVRLQENFDWLSPEYQTHHTKEEVIGWFRSRDFNNLKLLPHGFIPKVGALGIKK